MKIIVAAVLLVGAVGARPVAALTLEDAFVAAYEKNPTLQAARAAARGADENVTTALAGWRPQVEAGASTSFRSTKPLKSSKWKDRRPQEYDLRVSQTLFNGFTTSSSVAAAEDRVLVARENLKQQEQLVFQRVAQAYYSVLLSQETLELRKKYENVLAQELTATRARENAGQITATEVSKAKARYAEATANSLGEEAALKGARATFERVVGIAPPDDLQLHQGAHSSVNALLPQSSEEAVALAVEGSPRVLAAKRNASAAAHDVQGVAGGLWPSVKLSVVFSGDQDRKAKKHSWEDWNQGLSAQAALTVPLYRAGTYSRLRAAKQTAGQRRAVLDSTVATTREDVITAWSRLQSSRAAVVARKAQVTAAQNSLQGYKAEAKMGSRSLVDVLDQEREALDARIGLERAKSEEQFAYYAVLAAVGRLTAKAIDLDVDLYDPAQHYEDTRGSWF